MKRVCLSKTDEVDFINVGNPSVAPLQVFNSLASHRDSVQKNIPDLTDHIDKITIGKNGSNGKQLHTDLDTNQTIVLSGLRILAGHVDEIISHKKEYTIHEIMAFVGLVLGFSQGSLNNHMAEMCSSLLKSYSILSNNPPSF